MAGKIETMPQASAEAQRRYGERAVVGFGRPVSRWDMVSGCYVGWKDKDEWRWLGVGETWDEAFANVREVTLSARDHVEFKK